MIPTAEQLMKIAGGKSNAANIASIVAGLTEFGKGSGLDKPHRLAHYVAQIAHESGRFKHDKEIWGPTKAQERYDTRTDLGNTAAKDGDGKRYAGRGPIQITGKSNYQQFTDWCRKQGFADVPDFVATPDAVNTDPWEGLVPIWYWVTRGLNSYADANDIEMLTRRINGGTNGLPDRLELYTRSALVLTGYGPTDVLQFQRVAQARGLLPEGEDQLDGVDGPKTRAALHQALVALDKSGEAQVTAKPAPVTEIVDVKSPPKGGADVATGAGVATAGLGGILQQLQQSLTPFSSASKWINILIVCLIIAGAVLTAGGLGWRWWASRRKKEIIADLNMPGTVAP